VPALDKVTCIEDLREIYRRNAPKAFFEYVDHGSYAEETLRANRADLQALKFRQRILRDISVRDQTTTILGEPAKLPLILAPIGSGGMQWGDGEIHACRAAQAAGIPYTLSTLSICSMEQVAANVDKPFWFQLYVTKDRGFCKSLIERAIAAKCSALVLTVDLQVLGQRHRDIKNGLSVPLKIANWQNLMDMVTKPRWLMGIARGKSKNFGNIVGHLEGAANLDSTAGRISRQWDASLNWNDVAWIRSLWPGKLILKGIHDVEDAQEAIKTGAQAIVVSNHGGRQLDGAPSSISVLPGIVDAVGSQTEVIFDSGIRSGQDVMRALALGAKSCMIGRAYIYGLGAAGQAGVAKAIEIIGNELSVTMGLCGANSLADIGPHVLTARSRMLQH
jgi:L-lactate dehydrogenase (cytochrome)